MSVSHFVKVIEKDADFDGEVLQAPLPVLADFGATWCGPCRMLTPIVDKIAQDYQGRVKVVSIDIDECTETTRKYGIKSVPTVLVFQGGQKTGMSVGLTSRENLLKLLGL
ncbi:MAG TPA: thioredoxin [Polyangiaceae bacterium]|nr:thioredoxin [Polyangiaceae bacterium]